MRLTLCLATGFSVLATALRRRSATRKKPLLVLLPLLLLSAGLMIQAGSAQTGMVFTSLYSFTGGTDGYTPNGVVQGRDGFLYGTTVNGGTNSAGAVFRISTGGSLTNLYSFSGGSDGGNPQAALVQGTDGYFYGTTQTGGQPTTGGPAGTVFRISPSGALTNLYSFTDSFFMDANQGASPQAALVQGSDGTFYGTTFQGGTYFFANSGTNGYGTVFKINTNGVLTSLYRFGGNDGENPQAALVQGNDGNLYGTTQSGGISNDGTVFQITTNGTLTSLHSFSGGNDGGGPLAGLVQGNDGYFYGTTPSGGISNAGTVFQISTNGVLTNLYSFLGGNDGANPYAGLVLGSDGSFYGTTQSGGTNGGEGTIFKISASGAYTSLYSFSGGNDGANPQAALVQGSDGSFYGTTANGGQSGAGTVFRLTLPLGPPQLAIVSAGTNFILTWTSAASGYTLQSTPSLVRPVVWASVSPAPVVINGQNTVTNPITGSQQFFRLNQ
jgi:uncharacterized repeat protein (TIGR03803 family)